MRLYKANIFPSGSDHTPNAMRSIRVPLCAQLKNVLLAAVCTTLVTSSAYADDSEVFFREIFRVKEHQPNVLFVMDTSWSMAHKDEAEKLYTPRIDRLKNAMSTFLNEARNVNVGVMRINGEKGGGGLIYPSPH